ncbi:MAG: hypothetical protein B7Y73_05530 [Acidocella sp. 35-58-6]|nr:MAG: hypothetical protein B7Y73_05530 [Acidocella sp. 35-58-6]
MALLHDRRRKPLLQTKTCHEAHGLTLTLRPKLGPRPLRLLAIRHPKKTFKVVAFFWQGQKREWQAGINNSFRYFLKRAECSFVYPAIRVTMIEQVWKFEISFLRCLANDVHQGGGIQFLLLMPLTSRCCIAPVRRFRHKGV